jgi:hypothetical protein
MLTSFPVKYFMGNKYRKIFFEKYFMKTNTKKIKKIFSCKISYMRQTDP